MAFHIKDDFKAGPVSQVPVSWYNSVAKFLNGLVGGFGISTEKNESGASTISLKRETLKEELDNFLSADQEAGTPQDMTDSPSVYDSNGDTATWTAGGTDGVEIDCYCKIGPQASGSNYSVFQRCRLTYSKHGLLVKAEMLGDRIRIQAKNA